MSTRLITILVSAALLVSINSAEKENWRDNQPRIQAHFENYRIKRDASNATELASLTSNNTISENDTCLLGPLAKLQDAIAANASRYGSSSGTPSPFAIHQFYGLLTPETLDDFCKIYLPRQREISLCPNSTLKTQILSGFSVFHFMCNDRSPEMKEQLPCLHRVDPQIGAVCGVNCSEYQNEAGTIGQLAQSPDLKLLVAADNKIAQSIASFCKHLICLMQCETEIIDAECGKEAAKLVRDGIRATFQGLKSLDHASCPIDELN